LVLLFFYFFFLSPFLFSFFASSSKWPWNSPRWWFLRLSSFLSHVHCCYSLLSRKIGQWTRCLIPHPQIVTHNTTRHTELTDPNTQRVKNDSSKHEPPDTVRGPPQHLPASRAAERFTRIPLVHETDGQHVIA